MAGNGNADSCPCPRENLRTRPELKQLFDNSTNYCLRFVTH